MPNPFRLIDSAILNLLSLLMGIVYRCLEISPRRHASLFLAVTSFASSAFGVVLLLTNCVGGPMEIKDFLGMACMAGIPLIVAVPYWKHFQASSNTYNRTIFTEMSVDAEFERTWDYLFGLRVVLFMAIGLGVWVCAGHAISDPEVGKRAIALQFAVWFPTMIFYFSMRAAAPPPPYSGKTRSHGFRSMRFA